MIKNQITAIISIMVFFITCIPGIVAEVSYVPSSSEEIHLLADSVFREGILDYMEKTQLENKDGKQILNQLQQATNFYPEYPRRITDSKNTTITIYHPLSRIAAFNYRSIIPLDYGEQVVGVADGAMDEAIIYPGYLNKTDIGGVGMGDPDFEKILSLNPDAVTAYTDLMSGPEFFEKRMPTGVPVIRFDFIKSNTMVQEIKKMGYLVNKTERSQKYEEWYTDQMTNIDKRLANIPENERLRVFVDIWSSKYAHSTERRTASGNETYSFGKYCIDAGGKNIAYNVTNPQKTVETEWVAEQNPDVILGVVYDGGYNSKNISVLSSQYEDLLSDPVLKNVPAIKNKRIYIISFRFTNDLGYPAARMQIAKWFYPNVFSDMNPVEVHQDYVNKFINSSFNVSNQGIYFYNPN